MVIPLPGVQLELNEFAFLLLPFINLFCTSPYKKYRVNDSVKAIIILYLGVVFFTEFFIKPFVFSQSLMDSFKAFRLGIPLYSSLILLLFGIKADVKKVWMVLLSAIGASVLISLLSLFVSIPIYNTEGQDVLTAMKGRLMNSNASFGAIGLFLLFVPKSLWYANGPLVKWVSFLGIISLLMTFNRTFMALLVIQLLYLGLKNFSFKLVLKAFATFFAFITVGIYVYHTSESIQKQLDKRILTIIFQEKSIVESTVSNNRDVIYQGVENRINEGFWLIGLPYKKAVFEYYTYTNELYKGFKTDISYVNVLLRYGITAFLLFLFLFFLFYKFKYVPPILLFVYMAAALNTDALFNQNSIFFIIVFIIILGTKSDLVFKTPTKRENYG
ncbi:hypothetical protein ACFS5J_03325 [Flavobacterium chuncheonense]|uniref:O-antigen ligase domain-containing protein n=1 Tax=Flavobacterium chuncheonense TaxID=2026653 RepID=A0ABW5YIZ4_9FLAO